MTPELLSTAHLDYLQRTDFDPSGLADGLRTSAGGPLHSLWAVAGTGRPRKRPESPWPQRTRSSSEDLLTGLYGYKIPIAFVVRGSTSAVGIFVGTWSAQERENAPAAVLDERRNIVRAAMDSLYPSVQLAAADVDLSGWAHCGLVLGIPTAKPPDPVDGAASIDRIIRALQGSSWAIVVMAEPVEESAAEDVRRGIINEMRRVEAGVQSEQAPSPLAAYYDEMLKSALASSTSALATGGWRTAVYLLGDSESYPRLASIWRGVFSGDKSQPEPVRVWDSEAARELASTWAISDAEGPDGPGHYHYPLRYQTLLTSAQLAAYVHLPQLETSGFRIFAVPRFDSVPAEQHGGSAIRLGDVMIGTRRTDTSYDVDLRSLTRHAFIAGVTGAGKTNTIFNMLQHLDGAGVPFLVLEPAKTEYRTLLDSPQFAERLRILTLGDETVSPFRLNPFEVLPGTPVAVHLDLLRSVFSASFGMWTPLPQVLERCMHHIYIDRGWDLTSNTNYRLDDKSDTADAFPTLSDLVAKVDEVARELGYEERVTSDIRAALHTRINSLRTGGKGRMLDVQRSFPMELLLEHPTVLELENVGDDDDKAFLMGLLFIRLVEYRRARGQVDRLQNLLIIEEAHRLLANVAQRMSEEEADPRGKAIETFTSLLSEIRAYGQGVAIADQVPVRLTPDVIKNTNLKIVHRVVAADDRAVLAGSMAMDDEQSEALAVLALGQAAVFREGDDSPLLIQVPRAKDQSKAWPDDGQVGMHMEALRSSDPAWVQATSESRADASDPAGTAARDAARMLVDDPLFQQEFVRFVLSVVEDDGALARLWDGLLARERAVRRRGMDEKVAQRWLLHRASDWFASRRGSQSGWTYSETAGVRDRLSALLMAHMEGVACIDEIAALRRCLQDLQRWRVEPFPGCNSVCGESGLCLYRFAVADYLARGKSDIAKRWSNDYEQGGLQKVWDLCQNTAYQFIEPTPVHLEAVRRIGLCLAQQMLNDYFPEIHQVVLSGLLEEAKSPGKEGIKK